MPEQAINHLKEGFAIDKSLGNKRGLGMVVPILCRALQKANRRDEAVEICAQAVKIAPRNKHILKVKNELESFSKPKGKGEIKKGVIKCILQKESGFRFGFIIPADGSGDIYFGESQIPKKIMPLLVEGLPIVVEIERAERGPRVIRVWLDENL
ncbi:MAG: cold shock domain-containing protein [Spirochaetales bacterium]|nr:cold shock domain-containing protein [Spirochaetales bacterium]